MLLTFRRIILFEIISSIFLFASFEHVIVRPNFLEFDRICLQGIYNISVIAEQIRDILRN